MLHIFLGSNKTTGSAITKLRVIETYKIVCECCERVNIRQKEYYCPELGYNAIKYGSEKEVNNLLEQIQPKIQDNRSRALIITHSNILRAVLFNINGNTMINDIHKIKNTGDFNNKEFNDMSLRNTDYGRVRT
jgi:hypothetical protein